MFAIVADNSLSKIVSIVNTILSNLKSFPGFFQEAVMNGLASLLTVKTPFFTVTKGSYMIKDNMHFNWNCHTIILCKGKIMCFKLFNHSWIIFFEILDKTGYDNFFKQSKGLSKWFILYRQCVPELAPVFQNFTACNTIKYTIACLFFNC